MEKGRVMKPVDELFPGRKEAIEQGKCFGPVAFEKCEGDGTASKFKDEESKREYELTGLCQECQDVLYAYMEEMEGQEEPDPTEYVEKLSDEDLQEEAKSIMHCQAENGPNWDFDTDPYNLAVNAEVKKRGLKVSLGGFR